MSRADEPAFQPRGIAPPFYALILLPSGFVGGFATVTLGYVLSHHGVGVAAIAGLVGVSLLPLTWQFVAGPMIDISLTAARWYLVCTLVLMVAYCALAFSPMTPRALPLLDVLIFTASAAGTGQNSAGRAAMAATTPVDRRGPIAGWSQAANLGGQGLGGGLGLWISTHAGGVQAAALSLAGLSALCAAPMLYLRAPRRDPADSLGRRLSAVGSEMLQLIRTRSGALAIIVVTIPAALGAVASIIASVAGHWRASADLVALTNGVLSGAISIPGCIFGGYLCIRFPSRPVYVWGALACALEEAAMALAPHTPAAFVGFILGYNLLLGVAYGGFATVVYECLGRAGAATVGGFMFSLANLPVLLVTLLVGQVGKHHGANTMLLTEAAIAVVVLAAYSALAWFWKPRPSPATAAPQPELALT
ncbi:MAG TPA: MFS transporter [Caulobacteraceae bacterium]|nr:MFS transporter [Caulobacteraceae bacterium]